MKKLFSMRRHSSNSQNPAASKMLPTCGGTCTHLMPPSKNRHKYYSLNTNWGGRRRVSFIGQVTCRDRKMVDDKTWGMTKIFQPTSPQVAPAPRKSVGENTKWLKAKPLFFSQILTWPISAVFAYAFRTGWRPSGRGGKRNQCRQ